VIFTVRSVAIGIIAWLMAFAVAYVSRINPADLTGIKILALVLSGLVGLAAALVLGKKYCRSGTERRSAMWVVALGFFCCIYVPVTTIWANASFYRYALDHPAPKGKTSLPAAGVEQLSVAIERVGASYYLGLLALLAVGWYLAHRTNRHLQQPKRLNTFDMSIGLVTLMGGLWMALRQQHGFTEPVQWVGYFGVGFLVCLLARSLRTSFAGLATLPSEPVPQPIPGRSAAITLIFLWLVAAAGWFGIGAICVSILRSLDSESLLFFVPRVMLCGALVISPLLLFRLLTKPAHRPDPGRAEVMGLCATRLGTWSGVAWSFFLSALLMPGIAENVLTREPGIPLPFWLCMSSVTPLLSISGVLWLTFWAGGFVAAACLPKSARASERILTPAQGGAMAGIILHVTLFEFSLCLALVTVEMITRDPELLKKIAPLFVAGGWSYLTWGDAAFLVFLAGSTAALWAMQGSIVCAAIWLLRPRIIRAVKGSAPPPIPARNPPPAPSA